MEPSWHEGSFCSTKKGENHGQKNLYQKGKLSKHMEDPGYGGLLMCVPIDWIVQLEEWNHLPCLWCIVRPGDLADDGGSAMEKGAPEVSGNTVTAKRVDRRLCQ